MDHTIIDGPKNDFPQYLAQILYRSPTATAALGRLKDFIIGTGVHDDLKDVVVNPADGTTFQEFHAQVANDFAWLNRLAIKIRPKRGNDIESVSHIPVEWVRWSQPDENDKVHSAVVDPYILTMQADQKEVKMPLWEKDIKKRNAAIRQFGEKYKGHIYFFNIITERNRVYSRPDFFSSENFINTDYKTGLFTDRFSDNNFFLGGILNVYGDPDMGIEEYDEENSANSNYKTVGEEFEQNLSNSMSGADNAGGVLVNWIQNSDEVATFQPYQTGNSHEVFTALDKIVLEKICIAFGVPKILLPLPTAGKLGDSQEMRNAIMFLNERTEKYRQVLEETYRFIFSDFSGIDIPEDEPIIKRVRDYTDLPDMIFRELKKDQKDDYLQEKFHIEPSEMMDDEQVRDEFQTIINQKNGRYN